MLELKSINVHFGATHVLKNLSCRVEQGDFIVIVGANGAGKSSFFDTIAGKIQPKSGQVLIDTIDVTAIDELQRSSMVTRIFQNTRLNSVGCLTVAQNLAIAHYSRRSVRFVDGMKGLSRQRAVELIQDLGMDESILDRPMHALSGGQRQLIAFVMSTRLIPKILLLDEPTAALDPQASTKLLEYAAKFIKKHNVTTLLITHDPEIALSIGNKIWILENGIISQQFTADQKKNLHPDKLIGQIDYQALKLI
jgi:putative ABC transport system ATP-binding protein